MNRNKLYPLYFTSGALVLYILIYVIPAFAGLGLAFTDWNRFSSEINFVGLENFRILFSSSGNYSNHIINTLIFAVGTIILKTIIALLLALLLHNGIKRFTSVYRVLVFLPAILPMIVIGIIFKSILHPRSGLLNEFFRGVGLDGFAQQWLVDPTFAMPTIIAVDTWKGVGYIMVILLAGLQAIPQEYYEVADIDGATALNKLIHVTIPLLMPMITVTTVLNILHALKVFDIVYVLTNGGPGYTTEVVYTSIFKEFSRGRFGIGTAISSIMFIVMVFIGYFVIRAMSRNQVEA